MRGLILTMAIVTGGLTLPAISAHESGSAPAIRAVAVVAAAQEQGGQQAQPPAQQQPQPPQINVEVHRGARVWYANPVWMAIGGIAAIVVILLIVMAARGGGGGGTTVVRG